MRKIIAILSRWLALSALLLVSAPATAAEVTVTWTPPATRENGDTLAPDELGPYALYLWNGDDVAHTIEIAPSATTLVVDNLEQYTSRDLGITITASDNTGQRSKHSARVNINIHPVSAPVIILRWGE